MAEWTRQTALEDAFQEMHGIKPQVYYQRIDRNTYRIKLVLDGKEVVLQEIMDKGLTKEAGLYYGLETKSFTNYHTAEVEAVNILKG